MTLSSYHIAETEVTQELWQAVMGDNPSFFEGSNLPVEQVSWDDCHTFINKLNQLTGRQFRLPTEAEWEYAARGGKWSNGYLYSGSNNVTEVAWIWENEDDETTHQVKTKKPNELGIYDMSGNVSEWCEDWYGMYPKVGETKDPKGPDSGETRVVRGGNWNTTHQRLCSVSARTKEWSYKKQQTIGMRLAL